MSAPRRLHLVDAPGLFYRAHFAFAARPLTTSSGVEVGATYGFLATLLALIREEGATHGAAAFDTPDPTFRHLRYPDYKATRAPMPPELAAQMPNMDRCVAALGMRALRETGFEADDLIGSLARQAREAGWEVVIVSADKDFAQMIGGGVRQFVPSRGRDPARWLDSPDVRARWGVDPGQFVDFLALIGDSSDNIPGVRGIGPKTAARLLQEHGDLERLYGDLQHVGPAGVRARLEGGRAAAFLSRELAAVRTDLPGPDPALLQLPDPATRSELRALVQELEFTQMQRRLFGAGVAAAAPVPPGPAQLTLEQAPEERARSFLAAGRIEAAEGWGKGYRIAASAEELAGLAAELAGASGPVGIAAPAEGSDARSARLVGLALALRPGDAVYVPLAHREGPNVELSAAAAALGARLRDPRVAKVGHDLKAALHALSGTGLEPGPPLIDGAIASYLRDPDARHAADALAQELLHHRRLPLELLTGTGRDAMPLSGVAAERLAIWACEEADASLRLWPPLRVLLEERAALELFERVEMPLVPVLMAMEQAGVQVDARLLAGLADVLGKRMATLEAEIHSLAGRSFNINSTRQLQAVLFDELKLRARRRTKTGFSTGQEVLEELALEHPLPARILEFRQAAKLSGTYAEALPRLIDPATGRIHTRFHQTVTVTGRLSSSDPNLQNIPIRSELGRELRRAFVAPAGHRLLSADYSQIELRLLAHLSEDDDLIAAFRAGADIHRATAARVFGVAPEQVDPAMRARAKVVNFGVLYGMGAQRLAREQGIPVKEAARFIADYFARLPGVQRFVERAVELARQRGYAETLMGRRRYLPELASARAELQAAAQRMAVNAPVQGSAADLIKAAMVRLDERLRRELPQARLLLQVHDELLLEAPEEQIGELRALVVEVMESVAVLRVPLRVETGVGRSWFDAHA